MPRETDPSLSYAAGESGTCQVIPYHIALLRCCMFWGTECFARDTAVSSKGSRMCCWQ